ncbi:MAG: pyruvate dehydrogenase [Proteobacteria bacterium]|nr:pyruvate dehydrogenase [Pseudomonadota bacterium]
MRFIVCIDVIPTEMTDFADIILPSSDYLETWNSVMIEPPYTEGICFRQPITPPLYDTKSEEEIFYEISERLGVLDAYNEVINLILGFNQKPHLKLQPGTKYSDRDIAERLGLLWNDKPIEWYMEHGHSSTERRLDKWYRPWEGMRLLFYIEDNGFGISVGSELQTPGGNIAANLAAFRNLRIFSGGVQDPEAAHRLVSEAVVAARDWSGPVLLRLTMPRLNGHSGQDNQAYKSAELLDAERARDPLRGLRARLVPSRMSEAQWQALERRAAVEVEAAVVAALNRAAPDPRSVRAHVFTEIGADGEPRLQVQGGLWPEGHAFEPVTLQPRPEAVRINMIGAIRRTLEHELAVNPKMLVFGEDVGAKGGVHSATLGLQKRFGAQRVFDTSLSEEGIIGRAVGMALAGLLPVPEIQFRKYADPAVEQLNDCGTLRWRTANRFAAPMVVRMPGGYFKCGDPWHSQCNEVQWVHAIGWQVAMPSNAQDAVGLLRAALRGNEPVIFFEHRAMLDAAWARRAYPGDDYVVPFGRAQRLSEGSDITVVSWGAMVERCEAAAAASGVGVDLIDLRTLVPWDAECVLESVRRTRRCLIVHEDTMTAGFGAEIAARLARDAFLDLDAPVERMAMPDIPSPHSPVLLEAALPSSQDIAAKIRELVEF